MAAKREIFLEHDIGRSKGIVDSAAIDCFSKGEIVAEIGMQDRYVRVEGRFGFCRWRDHLPLDGNLFAGIFRQRPALSYDHDNRLPLPAGPVHRHRKLRGRFHAFETRQRTDPGTGASLGQLRASHNQHDTWHRFGFRGIDLENSGMRVRAAHKCRMDGTWQTYVVRIAAATSHGPPRARPGK